MIQDKTYKIIFSYLLILFGLSIFINNYLQFNKKISLISIFIFFFSIFIYFSLGKKEHINVEPSLNTPLFVILIFLTTIVTQNVNLNFETLDWDIHSYLVVAMDIDRGYIPLENQWESKGPLLFYLYNLFYKLSFKNFVYFKIVNDLILFLISLFLLFTVSKKSRRVSVGGVSSSFLFIILMGQTFAQAEYSEVYSLLFISAAYYFLSSKEINKRNLFIVSTLFSLSTLVNQGAVLFVFGFLFYLFLIDFNYIKNNYKNILIGLSLPHLFFLIIYIINNLFFVYKATYIDIPLGYTAASLSSTKELVIFLRSYFNFDIFTYTTLIFLISIFILLVFVKRSSLLINNLFKLTIINIFISLIFYFVGSHNYYHHLFFLLYFLCFVPSLFENNNIKILIFFLILSSSISVSFKSFDRSFHNLKNVDTLLENYPLYQASKLIEENFSGEYNVFALDYVAVLHYLDKANFSYIVHPSNHFEPYIADTLIKANKIESDEVNKAILRSPDVILCSGTKIISGKVIKETNFNCAISDWNKKYISLDTKVFKENKNLSFYYDPYRPIGIYFKLETMTP